MGLILWSTSRAGEGGFSRPIDSKAIILQDHQSRSSDSWHEEDLKASETLGKGSAGGFSEVRGGAVIMIGPIPIVLGSDPASARALLTLAVVLTLGMILLLFLGFGKGQ